MNATATRKAEKSEAIERLKTILSPGDTVHTVLRHVSASGMQRRIDLYAFKVENGKVEKYFLTGYAAKAIESRHEFRKGGLVVNGCGMDMGFHVVDSLSWAMYGNGTSLRQEWL